MGLDLIFYRKVGPEFKEVSLYEGRLSGGQEFSDLICSGLTDGVVETDGSGICYYRPKLREFKRIYTEVAKMESNVESWTKVTKYLEANPDVYMYNSI